MGDPAAGEATADRRAEALSWAAAFRGRRAELCRRLAGGEVTLADALGPEVSGDPQLGLLKLLPVLESLPGARKVDTRRRLASLGLDPTTALRALTAPQRRALLEHFAPDHATGAGPEDR